MKQHPGEGLHLEDSSEELPTDVDPLSGPAFGPDFAEKFLTAVIDAYPVGRRTRRQRLDAAMMALFGRKSSYPLLGDLDEQVLLWMAEQGRVIPA